MAEIMDVSTESTQTEMGTTQVDTTGSVGWMSPDGNFGKGAPENIQTLLDAKKWTNVSQLTDAYKELEAFKGIGEHLVIPEAEDAEGWDNIYKQLGRPETYDKYEYKDDPEVPLIDEIVDKWKQNSFKEGKTQKQFAGDIAFYQDLVKEIIIAEQSQLTAQKEANIKALKEKFGEVNYDVKIKDARMIADKLGIYKTLEAKGLASDPDIIGMLDMIATKAAEDVITSPSSAVKTKSPQEELKEIKKSDSFIQKFHSDHKTTMDRFIELNQMIADSRQRPVSRQAI
jgi:hypothetical protein